MDRIIIMRRFKTFTLQKECRTIVDGEEPVEMEVYRSPDGGYIADRHRKRRPGIVKFIAAKEIIPEKSSPKCDVCIIGKSAADGKWYGWSHRAICGFGLGDRIFDERYGADKPFCPSCVELESCEGLPCPNSIPFVLHGEKSITNNEEARQAAVAFAESVG